MFDTTRICGDSLELLTIQGRAGRRAGRTVNRSVGAWLNGWVGRSVAGRVGGWELGLDGDGQGIIIMGLGSVRIGSAFPGFPFFWIYANLGAKRVLARQAPRLRGRGAQSTAARCVSGGLDDVCWGLARPAQAPRGLQRLARHRACLHTFVEKDDIGPRCEQIVPARPAER